MGKAPGRAAVAGLGRDGGGAMKHPDALANGTQCLTYCSSGPLTHHDVPQPTCLCEGLFVTGFPAM